MKWFVCIRERYKIFLGRILCEFLQEFRHFKDLIPSQTSCQFKKEMKSQSQVIPFPVLMNDEKKYSELVDMIDTLESWVHELCSKAGVSASHNSGIPVLFSQPQIGTGSHPSQPAEHVPPVHSDDPLPTIPCYGDQLSRVRMAGAKDIRAGCHTAAERLDHLYTFRIADWHTKRSYLKVSLDTIAI